MLTVEPATLKQTGLDCVAAAAAAAVLPLHCTAPSPFSRAWQPSLSLSHSLAGLNEHLLAAVSLQTSAGAGQRAATAAAMLTMPSMLKEWMKRRSRR